MQLGYRMEDYTFHIETLTLGNRGIRGKEEEATA